MSTKYVELDDSHAVIDEKNGQVFVLFISDDCGHAEHTREWHMSVLMPSLLASTVDSIKHVLMLQPETFVADAIDARQLSDYVSGSKSRVGH